MVTLRSAKPLSSKVLQVWTIKAIHIANQFGFETLAATLELATRTVHPTLGGYAFARAPRRHGKLKDASIGQIDRRPKDASMGLDDGAAPCQAPALSFGFGREEGVEQPAHLVGIESGTGIADGYQHIAGLIPVRADLQQPRPVLDGVHRFDAIHDQIKDHLLQLHSVNHERADIG